jgi:DNA primase catalytic core
MSAARVDFDQIKRTTDLVRVVESYGITLRKVGQDHVGLCPFHDDHKPSLRVTGGKGLFRCPACGATGNVIQFVAKKEGLTDREAALKLLAAVPGVKQGSALTQTAAAPPTQTPPQAASGRHASAHPATLLQRVSAFHAKTLHKDRAGLDYLRSRKLADPTMLATFQIGYCNGTLPKVLPQDGGELVDGLKALGVLNAKGQEHFRGCVTVPILDEQGNVCGIYGRRITEAEPRHLYLSGPHRGVFNQHAARTNKIIFLTEAILDAMSLWQAGFKNVIALYGAQGWTADHERLLREGGTREAWLALDNDEAGRDGTERLKEKLAALGVASHVVPWPEGVKDANDFFQSRGPQEFETLLAQARPPQSSNAAGGRHASAPQSETLAKLGEEQITPTPTGFVVQYGSRRYDVRAIERPSPARLRATLKALSTDPASLGRFHIDTVDFYLSRSRRPFVLETARLFHETADIIESDLNRLTERLEKQTTEPEPTPLGPVMTAEEQTEAVKLGRASDLVDEIVRDLTKLGPVGEDVNKLTGYLAMTSRKMDDPLALLILSGSGAGKSLLQDAILKLCPDEDLVKLTSLTDRALFYKGEDSLKHKVLAVEEVAGAEGAYYAIRNLISAKKLVIETTVKNPMTGQLTTQLNTVNGPTAVFQTTTQPDLDAETRSRFLLTSIDESPEQTRAILDAQRQSHTLDGLRRRKQREAIIRRHHAFQRLLKPVAVVNPFEPLLTYAADRLAVRRDHPKYQQLILVVTFLHQMQREVKHDAESGVDYIETTLDDIAIANELATALLGQSLDELSQPGRELLRLIFDYVQRQAARQKTSAEQVAFTRRELREALKWSEYQLRTYLHELAQLEYVVPLSGRQGQSFRYRLFYDGQGGNGQPFLAGLKSVEQLRQEAGRIGLVSGEPASRTATEVRGAKPKLRGDAANFAGASLNGSPEVKPASQPVPARVLRHGAETSRRLPGNAYRKNGAERSLANV